MSYKKFAISIILFLLFGCYSIEDSNSVEISTIQPSITPTMIIEKPRKITPTSTFIAPTFETFPTLSTDEAFESVKKYLKNQIPCQLPCWLGIIPGISTTPDVKRQLIEFSGISNYLYFAQVTDIWIVGNLDMKVNEGNEIFSISTSYLSKMDNNIVSSTAIFIASGKSREGNLYADENYNEFLSAYTLPQIVEAYGLPTQTLMTADLNVAEPTSPDYFIIRVLYPELGIFIKYDMPMETKESTYKFCVSEAIISFEILSQEYRNSYYEFFRETSDEWAGITDAIVSPSQKPVYDAIGLDDKVFYDKLVYSPNLCFESPINIWPEP